MEIEAGFESKKRLALISTRQGCKDLCFEKFKLKAGTPAEPGAFQHINVNVVLLPNETSEILSQESIKSQRKVTFQGIMSQELQVTKGH